MLKRTFSLKYFKLKKDFLSIENLLILIILLLKILISFLFSSGFLNTIFLPFVNYYTHHFNNPWKHFFYVQSHIAFPYPPLMLYILSPFSWAGRLIHSLPITIFLMKIPIFLSDFFIFFILCKIRPDAKKKLILIYLTSPIIFFSAYMEGQLDLISTALLLGSVYYVIHNDFKKSAVVFSCSTLCKSIAWIAFPFLLIYMYRKFGWKPMILFFIVSIFIYLFLSFPFLYSSKEYINTVFFNPQQNFIFNSNYSIGNLKIFPTVFLLTAIVIHFSLYRKINSDLLLSYLALSFSALLIFAYPIPSWFVWMIPFLSIFLIQSSKQGKEIVVIYLLFCFLYLLFFVCCYKYPLEPQMATLTFLTKSLHFSLFNENESNIIFTLLATMLITQIYFQYKFSIQSNNIYHARNQNLAIGVSGDSGSGKSILLEDFKDLLGTKKVTFLEGDSEHRWERDHQNWNKFTHLDPKANLLHQQASIIHSLKSGKKIYRRNYDHHTGKFTESKTILPKEYIIIAGLHPFYLPIARKLIDIKIFLDTHDDLRRHWKILRDSTERGYSKEMVVTKLNERKIDGEKYILPQKNYADICFSYFNSEFSEMNDECYSQINLAVRLSANIDLEKMFFSLDNIQTLNYKHDFSEDLNNQLLVFSGTITSTEISLIANNSIENIEELIDDIPLWQPNLRGLRQLLILTLISYHLKTSH